MAPYVKIKLGELSAKWRMWASLGLLHYVAITALCADHPPVVQRVEWTELHRAVEAGDVPKAEALIAQGAKVDARGGNPPRIEHWSTAGECLPAPGRRRDSASGV